jgi:hypothetical protein
MEVLPPTRKGAGMGYPEENAKADLTTLNFILSHSRPFSSAPYGAQTKLITLHVVTDFEALVEIPRASKDPGVIFMGTTLRLFRTP